MFIMGPKTRKFVKYKAKPSLNVKRLKDQAIDKLRQDANPKQNSLNDNYLMTSVADIQKVEKINKAPFSVVDKKIGGIDCLKSNQECKDIQKLTLLCDIGLKEIDKYIRSNKSNAENSLNNGVNDNIAVLSHSRVFNHSLETSTFNNAEHSTKHVDGALDNKILNARESPITYNPDNISPLCNSNQPYNFVRNDNPTSDIKNIKLMQSTSSLTSVEFNSSGNNDSFKCSGKNNGLDQYKSVFELRNVSQEIDPMFKAERSTLKTPCEFKDSKLIAKSTIPVSKTLINTKLNVNSSGANGADISLSILSSRNVKSSKNSFALMKKKVESELNSGIFDEDGNLDKSKLTMRDLIFFNPHNNPIQDKNVRVDEGQSGDSELGSDNDNESTSPFPQLKIGSDGNIIFDPDSLVVNSSNHKKSRRYLSKSKFVKENGCKFKGKRKCFRKKEDTMLSLLGVDKHQGDRRAWSLDETIKFYKALSHFGADFSAMMAEFPDRTRRQIKYKFKREEASRLKYVDLAMTYPNKMDFDDLRNEISKAKRISKNILDKKEGRKKDDKKRIDFSLQDSDRVKRSKKNIRKKKKRSNLVRKPLDERITRLKQSIYLMKRKYDEEMIKQEEKRVEQKYLKKMKKGFCDCENSSCEAVDFAIPILTNFCSSNAEKDSLIQNLKTKDDVQLFFKLCAEIYPDMGKEWDNWIKKKVINVLMDTRLKKIACDLQSTLELKTQEKMNKKYQLFVDPLDKSVLLSEESD